MAELEMREDPINIRLKRQRLPVLKLNPKGYQRDIFCKCLEQNTIVYLGTGLGKTFIVVMYIQDPKIDEQILNNRKVVFLAPTQDLIKQQAEYINKQVCYTCKVFCGQTSNCGLHIDHWSKPHWESELQTVDVLFMTPQIFASAITTNILDWSQFSTVIFDECHHSHSSKNLKTSGHPYSQILAHYRSYFALHIHKTKPRLIGLTASLINNMPKNRDSIRDEIHQLERIFSAKCVTDLQVQESKPKVIVNCFDSLRLTSANDLIHGLLYNFGQKIDEVLKVNKAEKMMKVKELKLSPEQQRTLLFHRKLKLASLGFSIKPQSFSKVLLGLSRIRNTCGLWILSSICKKLVDVLETTTQFSYLNVDVKPIYKDFVGFLRKVYLVIEEYLYNFEHKGLLNHSRAKPKSLLDIIQREHERSKLDRRTTFSCVIFVQSRLEVVALCDWIKQVSATLPDKYGFIRCDYAVGIAAAHASKYACITKRKHNEQAKMLRNFRDGILNVIVTTSVLEEGIDLPVCSTVIRYDQVKNFRQHVQSRGRARQERSYFILMCEGVDYPKTIEDLAKYNDFEVTVREDLGRNNIRPAAVRSAGSPQLIRTEYEDEDFFTTKDRAVRISSTTAKTILAMYLNHQSRNTPFTEGVQYERFQFSATEFQTKLFLPSGCPFNEGVSGGIRKTSEAADDSAVVAAIKALHEAKELDENGVPIRLTLQNIDKFLAGSNLEPKIDELDKSLEGTQIESEAVKDFSYFEPYIRMRKTLYLSKDFESRTYKLLRISYVADEKNSRVETRYLFEKSVFGIIVDSATSDDFIPEILFSHYGTIKVQVREITNNLKINRREDHYEYLNFTHKLLLKCLSFRGATKIDISEFKFYCLFYLVQLDKDNRPDVFKMRASFGGARRTAQFQPGNVVKVNGHYLNQVRRNEDSDLLMIVRRVRRDINANSIGPRNLTYRQEAERKYNCHISDPNQPMIEVMPLSKDFAKTKLGAKSKKEYSTESLVYLEQFLEFFDEDASCVIQAFNKPAIIHRIYLYATAAEFDRKLTEATSNFRQQVIHLEPVSAPVELNIGAVMDCPDNDVNLDDNEAQEEGETDEEEEENEDEEDYEETDEDSTDSDGGFRDAKNYEEMLRKQVMNLNHNDDGFEPKWDLSEYREPNIQRVATEKQYYSNPDASLEIDAQTSPIFVRLEQETEMDRINLISKLVNFDLNSSINLDLDETLALQNRNCKVDKSIVPPIKFDGNSKPLEEASRSRSIVEALTLSRAQESYNLESLENIGDSFLKYVVSAVLFMNTDGNEGFLTSARSRLTCNNYFTYLAKKNRLGSFAITRSFDKNQLAYMMGSTKGSENRLEFIGKFYNRLRPKNLADLVESIIGSRLLYLGQFEALLAFKALGLDLFDDQTFKEFNENAVVFSKSPTALLEMKEETVKNEFKSVKRKLNRFEDVLGYKFNDISYLAQALTHPSALVKFTRSYERLEFYGDAILDYLVTIHLVTSGSKLLREDPGQITSSRSALVNNSSFAKLAIKYGYDLFISFCNHDIYEQLSRVRLDVEEDPEMLFIDMVEFDGIVKLLGDVFESVAAAIYIDSGNSIDTIWRVYYPMMKESIETEIKCPTKNLIVKLYETFPGHQRISYESVTEHTSEGNVIRTTCFIAGYRSFDGRGSNSRQAKLRAVQAAMKDLPPKETLDKLNREHNAKFGDVSDLRAAAGRGLGARGGGRGRGRGGNRGAQGGRERGYSSRGSSSERNWRNDSRGGGPGGVGRSRY